MNRRILLASAAALALFGCTTSSPATIAQQTISDAQLIVTALSALPNAIPGLTPSALASIGASIATAQAAVQAILPGITAAAAQPSVTTIGAAVQAVLSALGGIALPSAITAVIADIQSLLPIVQLAVGIAIAAGANKAISADQARLGLQAFVS